ncbi:glycolipid transfer protein GLTP [Cardiosporidium cionae]|uniref:Glycolipid transfer protein GLTP n=1 Tax=Cardiosporidium cionae TaxID=476202 RepID=A0ABQ7JF33_9APIC|nr:glycolipid transfer protein GLTP [Cardiosporidium cionae]|eukprot:KAF8822620.1 glycolipid transfer protein GLTP [Cardiosporidium cionae]
MSNDEGEALCSGISTAFNCAKDPNSGKIYTNTWDALSLLYQATSICDGLVDAAITLLPVYDRIFGQSMVANVLKNDLSNSSSMVRAAYLKDPEGKNTIDKLITKELIETWEVSRIVVSQIVSMAFNLCPSREELERRLGFNDPTAVEGSVRNLLSLIRPVVEDVKEKLIQSDCNFPDKV